MPPTQTKEGIRAAVEIREGFPGVGILLLSSYVEAKEAIELFSTTASGIGYLLKDSVADIYQLLDALTRISAGGVVLDPKLVVDLLGRAEATDPLDVLTPLELTLMAEGRSNAGIATTLWITEGPSKSTSPGPLASDLCAPWLGG